MKNALVNVNGQIVPGPQARVQVFDRSYLYGDSLYEVARTYGEKVLFLEEHLVRLNESARLCKMTVSQEKAELSAQCLRTLQAFWAQPGMAGVDAYCRLVLSRGVGRIGFGLNCLETPTQYSVIVQPLDPPSSEAWEKGASLRVAPVRIRYPRLALDPAMKSGNYLNSLLAFLEAAEEGYDDSLLCDADGFLTEGTTFNLFYVRRGILATPPLDVGILDGITRRNVIQCARELGIPVREVRFPKERLQEADEVFLTSTIKEVFPVTRLDGKAVAGGRPGPITRKLAESFRAHVPGWLSRGPAQPSQAQTAVTRGPRAVSA